MGLTRQAIRKRDSVDFEDHVWQMVRREFPEKLGWQMFQERRISEGSRADYALYRVKYGKRERAVVEAKNVIMLKPNHVEQLDRYAREYHASYRQIVIPAGTEIDDRARDMLEDLDIKLRWARAW
jgi:hypothetical protein